MVRPIKELVSGLKLVADTCTYFTSCSQQGSKIPPGSLQEKKTEMHVHEGHNGRSGVFESHDKKEGLFIPQFWDLSVGE